ncbi:hypothetical protein EPI10_023329 [Gossypium australe]|uniref:Uncharacterized protein n=1 Tax=Gossypium australe TaxID=47621 RepID=A0A5B6VUE1_9ROSI|nr:hypothetical protein EPI10_023329 [Gossypium australe]
MRPTKAPDSNSKDVEIFFLGILNYGKGFDSLNLTYIVLIPKILNPTSLFVHDYLQNYGENNSKLPSIIHWEMY